MSKIVDGHQPLKCWKCGNDDWTIARVQFEAGESPDMWLDVQCSRCGYATVVSGPVEDADKGEYGLGGNWWKGR